MSTLQNADVNRHNVHICSTENPYATIQHQLELPKLNVLCTTPWDVYRLAFFLKNSQYSFLSGTGFPLSQIKICIAMCSKKMELWLFFIVKSAVT